MRSSLGIVIVAVAITLAFGVSAAPAQTFTSGSTGAAGAFAPTANVTLTVPASGIFNFSTVNIPVGVTVRFARNAANTPVTILASGDVTIAGTIDVSGAAGGNAGGSLNPLDDNGGAGGAGGFDGGSGGKPLLGGVGGTGLGPGGGPGGTGGGSFNPSGGGFGTGGTRGCSSTLPGGAAYGTSALLPLIGGSGGGGGVSGTTQRGAGGGGGAGAILIAATGKLTVTGTIVAVGGHGGVAGADTSGGAGGSGGAIRLVATTIAGNIQVNVSGGLGDFCVGSGGAGRVRVEAFNSFATVSATGLTDPVTVQLPNPAVLATTPTLAITSVAGNVISATPSGSFATPDVTLPAGTTNPITVGIGAANIPPGTTVTVRVAGIDTAASSTTVTLAGTLAASTATASITIPTDQPSVVFAFATFTAATASTGSGPVFVEGEEVERVTVSAGIGTTSRVAYVTKSGRQIVVSGAR